MPRAVWNGTILADSENTVVVEGNHYFPANSLRREYLQQSDTTTVCGWKGTANYYNLTVDGQLNSDAAWCYDSPKSEAAQIAGHVAFWKGVQIEE